MEDNNALKMFKDVYEDKEAIINGRTYRLTTTTHIKRRKVFAFSPRIGEADLSFLDDPKFEEIEKIISNVVLFDGELLSKKPNHWDQYPEDYMIFISTMVGALCYPFLKGFSGV